jgi:chromosome segregation ATPase
MSRQEEFRIAPSGNAGVGEELSSQLQDAQTRLIELERQRQQLEAQQRELEELQQKQREMEDGRKDLLEQFARSLKVLERAEDQARRDVEQIEETRTAFTECLQALGRVQPERWDREKLHQELASALGLVDEARTVFRTCRAKLRVLREEPTDDEDDDGREAYAPAAAPGAAGEPADFGSILVRGFAQNFSLFVLGLIALVAYLMRHG